MKQNVHANNKPRVGVGVIIKQNQQIILGRRLNQPMQGSWQLPGGWIRFGETPEQTVQRQLSLFQNLRFGESKFVAFTNNVFDRNTHSLSLYFLVDCLNADPQTLLLNEQNSDWLWADWNELPQPLFLPLHLLKESEFSPFQWQYVT